MLSRPRLGASLFFLTNGALFASLLPRLPEVKETFDLSNPMFGLVVAATPAGSMLASALPSPLIRRFGARQVAAASSLALATLLAFVGFAPSAIVFVAVLFMAGLSDAITDAAQNVQGLRVQRHLGSSIINSLHALWSLGATLGGIIGAAFAAAGVPLWTHMLITSAVNAVIVVLAYRLAELPDGVAPPVTEAETGPLKLKSLLVLAPFVLLAMSGSVLEDTANNWSALYLTQNFAVTAGYAGLGYAIFLGGQFIGRFTGDPLTDRFGSARLAQVGGLLIVAGMSLALWTPVPALALVGFAVAGYGCATLVPAAFEAASRVPGVTEHTGVTMLSWLMRIGFLVTSPTIGLVTGLTSTRAGLVVPLAAGVVATIIAARFLPRPSKP